MNAGITGFSHIAVGISDLDRALEFYCGVLGLEVALRAEEHGNGVRPFHREAAYLRWAEQHENSFVVLDRPLDHDPFGSPAKIFQIGFHHIAFSVGSLEPILERARRRGTPIILEPELVGGRAYGYANADERPMVRTAFLRDPDGNLVQLDQWLGAEEAPGVAHRRSGQTET